MQEFSEDELTLPPKKYECKTLKKLSLKPVFDSFILDLDHTADVQ